jgi:hypothetical protein
MLKKFTYLITGILCFTFLFPTFLGGCSQPDGEGFAIYLTRDDIEPDKMPIQSHVELAEEPLFSAKDIINYDAQTHVITLESTVAARLSEVEVPTIGRSFMVCIDKSPVYWGAFWAMYSSQSFDGVTVFLTPPVSESDLISIQITLGYPTDEYFNREDPRNNSKIMENLEKWDKLINELPTTLIEELPHSMKGYELYSWEEDDEWHFRLITGTNRNKTRDEIVNKETSLEEMISIHATGTNGIRSVLNKLPENEEVFWLDGYRLDKNGDPEVILPEETIVEGIIHYAETCGIELTVISQQ